jgi:hypothetical protein
MSQSSPSKKEQILALFVAGARNVSELALLTRSRPSYVAEVLREHQELQGYFDLYTTTEQPMNIYSKFFAKRLGFKTPQIAKKSVQHLDQLYRQFARAGDRAGQHHALVMALTMFNRARWSNKETEAILFRRWLIRQLSPRDLPQELAPQLAALPHRHSA